jgi:heme iron utilization protein
MNEPSARAALVKHLFERQRLGALATRSDTFPYCNLIAFTPVHDIKSLIFVTPRATSKYRNLSQNKNVALLVDNRCEVGADCTTGIAVTSLGHAVEIDAGQTDYYRQLHSKRHEHLVDFINLPDIVFFEIHVQKYIIVQGVDTVSVLSME